MKDCEKSADGEHELNFEKMVYSRHISTHTAVFSVECLHCEATGELTVFSLDVDWLEGRK